jgi:hypothetical protein
VVAGSQIAQRERMSQRPSMLRYSRGWIVERGDEREISGKRRGKAKGLRMNYCVCEMRAIHFDFDERWPLCLCARFKGIKMEKSGTGEGNEVSAPWVAWWGFGVFPPTRLWQTPVMWGVSGSSATNLELCFPPYCQKTYGGCARRMAILSRY